MNPKSLSEIAIPLPNIPDKIPPLYDLPALIERYGILFRGYDSFQPEQLIRRNELDLENVLQDLFTCYRCSGECATKIGRKFFYKIDWSAMQFFRNHSMTFIVGECPGVNERMAQIRDLLAGKGIISYRAPENTAMKYDELREKLQGRNKVVNLGDRQRRANEWLD